MDIALLLALNAAISAACFFVLWRVSVRIGDVSFIDSWWALGLVLLALCAFVERGIGSAHATLIFGLCAVWGIRLGAHLYFRWRRQGPDRRYLRIIARYESQRGWSFARIAGQQVFGLQFFLQFIVSLPVQLGQMTGHDLPLGPLAWCGAGLACFGILFESLADSQLARFKRDPANRARVLDRGLWHYTRHPNYFGDSCVWWGLSLIALEVPLGIIALPAPILLTVLLTRWSGVPLVEHHMRRKQPEYESYMRRTSRFIPWPPWPV